MIDTWIVVDGQRATGGTETDGLSNGRYGSHAAIGSRDGSMASAQAGADGWRAHSNGSANGGEYLCVRSAQAAVFMWGAALAHIHVCVCLRVRVCARAQQEARHPRPRPLIQGRCLTASLQNHTLSYWHDRLVASQGETARAHDGVSVCVCVCPCVMYAIILARTPGGKSRCMRACHCVSCKSALAHRGIRRRPVYVSACVCVRVQVQGLQEAVENACQGRNELWYV